MYMPVFGRRVCQRWTGRESTVAVGPGLEKDAPPLLRGRRHWGEGLLVVIICVHVQL